MFIDIFVLDSVPDDPKELIEFRKLIAADKIKIYKMQYYLYAIYHSKISLFHPSTVLTAIISFWYQFKKKIFNIDELSIAYRKFEEDITKYNNQGMQRVANFSLNPLRKDSQLFDKKIYSVSKLYNFEGYHFPGPVDFETVLHGHYGNWHEHIVGSSSHGGIILDIEKKYTEYFVR